eukprot:3850766-Rhodomonas_salina.3
MPQRLQQPTPQHAYPRTIPTSTKSQPQHPLARTTHDLSIERACQMSDLAEDDAAAARGAALLLGHEVEELSVDNRVLCLCEVDARVDELRL